MKISKSSNKYLLFFIVFFFFNTSSYSNEPVDIWSLNKTDKASDENKKETSGSINLENEIKLIEIDKTNSLDVEDLDFSNDKLVGLYDPEENNLTLDMWRYSDSDQIKNVLKKIEEKNLSADAIEILKIALLTNSHPPKNLKSNNQFADFKISFLLKNKDLKLIKKFIIKNNGLENNKKLIKYYLNNFLETGNVSESCNIINETDFTYNDHYIDKFKIYCLIVEKKIEEAQLFYDLKKEIGFEDKFFEEKFSNLMGYHNNNKYKISEKNILDFHLSYLTNKNFEYIPSDNTPKFIWKYLSSNNLLENIEEIDLEDSKKIIIIEKATHDKNYSEKELLDLYRRFDFSFDQLLNVRNLYKKLPNYQARALLYQRLLLSDDAVVKVDLAKKIKKSFKRDKIENAFKDELSNILKNINEDDISSDQISFYRNNIIVKKKNNENFEINNKIIHQSKLLNYFVDEYNIDKITKDTNEILKKVKADKKYVFSNKDKMLLDSLIYDGVELQKKYNNLYDKNPNIPTDLQVLINDEDIGMILLRLVEIIGEDNIEDLGTETLYFITTTLNKIDLDTIRNNILIKTLPQKA